jgi:hypothetical protein
MVRLFTGGLVNVETYQWVYGLSCPGDGLPALVEAKTQEPRPVGSRVTVRYDPAQTSVGSVGSDGGDGQGLFILAGIAGAVLLLAGLVAAVLD